MAGTGGAGQLRWGTASRTQRVTTVDEEQSAGDEDVGQPGQCPFSRLRVAAVEGPDPHRHGEVVAGLVGIEHQVLAGRHRMLRRPAASRSPAEALS